LVEKPKHDSEKGNIRLIVIILALGMFGMLGIFALGFWTVIPTLWVTILSIALLAILIVFMGILLANPSWK